MHPEEASTQDLVRMSMHPTTQILLSLHSSSQTDRLRSTLPHPIRTTPALELTLDPIHHNLLSDIHNLDERAFIRSHFLILRFLLLDSLPVIGDGLFRVPLDVLCEE